MLRCEQCGKTDSSVETVIDPYNQEINGQEVGMVLCYDCYKDRLYSI